MSISNAQASLNGLSKLGALSLVVALIFSAGNEALAQKQDLTGAKTLYSGQWTKKTNKIAGNWSIVEKGGKRYVVLDSKFKTSNAPDLKIILSPTAIKDLKSKNAMQKAKIVSLLKSNKGAQTFEIPKGIDLTKFKSVAIHCEKYTKLWGGSALVTPKKTS